MSTAQQLTARGANRTRFRAVGSLGGSHNKVDLLLIDDLQQGLRVTAAQQFVAGIHALRMAGISHLFQGRLFLLGDLS